jgi:hypothetical protein
MTTPHVAGTPTILQHQLPDPEDVAHCGAAQTAAALAKAVELQEQSRAAARQAREATRDLTAARMRDKREHASLVEQDPAAKLTPKHEQRAQKTIEESERRAAALATACERSADSLAGVAHEQHGQLAEFARDTRADAVRQVTEAVATIRDALKRVEVAFGIDRWSSDPGAKRWRVAVLTMQLRSDLQLGQALDLLDKTPGLIEGLETTAEREERERREASQAAATNLSGFIGA